MKPIRVFFSIASIALIIEGFRLVTQAGLSGAAGTMQNDGYAVSGGILILVGGIIAGYELAKRAVK